MQVEFLSQATKEQLPKARWEHTLRVVETACHLAKKEEINLRSTKVAAILHDFCKFWSADKLRTWIMKYELPLDLLDYNQELWHGPVASKVAQIEFGIVNEDIIHAICYHTSGRPNMSKLEKIIYLADYIEPGRSFPGVDDVRDLVDINLNHALLKALDNSITFLISQKQKVFPLTLFARNELLVKIGNEEESI